MTTLEHATRQAYLTLCDEIMHPVTPIPMEVMNKLTIAVTALQLALAHMDKDYVTTTNEEIRFRSH